MTDRTIHIIIVSKVLYKNNNYDNFQSQGFGIDGFKNFNCQ